MTRALLEQALSLSGYYESTWVGDLGDLEKLVQAAIEAIRAHLAQPQGEPVAWINPAGTYAEASTSSTVYGSHTIPLYTHPAHTEDEVQLILRSNFSDPLFERTVRQTLGVPA